MKGVCRICFPASVLSLSRLNSRPTHFAADDGILLFNGQMTAADTTFSLFGIYYSVSLPHFLRSHFHVWILLMWIIQQQACAGVCVFDITIVFLSESTVNNCGWLIYTSVWCPAVQQPLRPQDHFHFFLVTYISTYGKISLMHHLY